MKSALILCALATVSCFNTGNATDNAGTADNTGTSDSAGTVALTGLKTEVQTTTNDLSSYGKSLVHDTRSKLTDLITAEFRIMYNVTNSVLSAIQSEIDQAILTGKNAKPCFEPSNQRIRQASIKSQVVLNRCSINALETVYPVEKSINALLQLGNRLTNELDTIAMNCMSSNAIATENCIIAKIPEAKSSVDAYRNNASSLKQNGDRTSSDAQISAHECYQPGVQTVRDVTNSVRSDAHQCVVNAETVDNAGTAMLMKLKSEIQTITNYVSDYGEKLYHDTQSKLSDLLSVEFRITENISNSALIAIQSEIDQAISTGKNAKPCFEPSRERIGQAHLESMMVLYKCFSNAVTIVDSIKESINAVRELGNRLTSELEAIAIDCISDNSVDKENCILAKIPETNSSFDAYLKSADSATKNGDRASLDVQVSAHECYQPGVQTLRDVTNGIRSDAHQCVVNA